MIRIHDRLKDDRGAAAVLIAVVLLVLIGTAALAVDAGSVWTNRRGLITDTDASALAAAQYLAHPSLGVTRCVAAKATGMSSDAGQEADAELNANDPDTSFDAFSVSDSVADAVGAPCKAGHVRVEASHNAPLTFAGIFGYDQINVGSVSMAQFGPIKAMTGLRPIGICSADKHFQEWKLHLDNPALPYPSPTSDHAHGTASGGGVIHTVNFDKSSPDACGEAPGNWGWLDFDARGGGSSELNDRLRNGYDGSVSLGDTATNEEKDCNPENGRTDEPCDSQPGAHADTTRDAAKIDGGLTFLDNEGITFPIVIYDSATLQGTNVDYNQVAFLLVKLHGFRISGAGPGCLNGDGGANGCLDLEFVDTLWSGSIGIDPSPNYPTIAGTQLCGGDYNQTDDNNCDV